MSGLLVNRNYIDIFNIKTRQINKVCSGSCTCFNLNNILKRTVAEGNNAF